MADSKVEIKLGSRCDTDGFDKAQRGIADTVKGAADIKSAFEMAAGAVKAAWNGIANTVMSAFRFETATTQFKTLIGDIDEAREHMKDLKELGDTPPFSLDEFAKASRSMMVLTDGALGFRDSLELVGDAAAATGAPLETMGTAVGRLYALIRDGEPVSRAALELRNMGALSPEVCRSLQDMQNAGRSGAEVWGEVEKALGRYKGAMKDTENTGEGLIGAIGARWDNTVRQFGEAFADTAKGGMRDVLDTMDELADSGAIDAWAETLADGLNIVISAASTLVSWLGSLVKGFKEMKDWAERAGTALGAGFSTLAGGGSFGDAIDSAGDAYVHEGQLQQAGQAGDDGARQRQRSQRERDRIQRNLTRLQARAGVEQEKQTIEWHINHLQGEIRDIRERQADTRSGMGVDRQNHAWNPYQYHFDRNGNIDFVDWQRTKRYGPETNDEQKNRRRREREDKRMEDLEKRWANGENLSDRELKKLKSWWDYKDERDGIKNREKQIEKWRADLKKLLDVSEKHLAQIEKDSKKLADEGPLD